MVGNIPKKIQEKKRALASLSIADRGDKGAEVNKLRGEINDLLDNEEIIWRQRSKTHWYREGDRNTKFFHAHAFERRKKKKKTLFWGCGMMMEFGARIKTASLPLQYPILRRFSPLPPQVESMKSHVHYQDVLWMI